MWCNYSIFKSATHGSNQTQHNQPPIIVKSTRSILTLSSLHLSSLRVKKVAANSPESTVGPNFAIPNTASVVLTWMNECLLSKHISQNKLVHNSRTFCTANVIWITQNTFIKSSSLCRVLLIYLKTRLSRMCAIVTIFFQSWKWPVFYIWCTTNHCNI